jgi:molybdopterin converting factor small subunit
MQIRLRLFPPLSDAAGTSELDFSLGEPATLRSVVDGLVHRFGPKMQRCLFDTEGRMIPSWAIFLNQIIVPLNRPRALDTPVHPRDEVSFILNVAGG